MPDAARTAGCAVAVLLALVLGLPATATAVPPIWETTFGAPLTISDDDDKTTSEGGETAVTFGTLAFPFYGTTYTGATQLGVDTNGLVRLGAAPASDNTPTATELVTATPPIIAPYWADLIATPLPFEGGDIFFRAIDDNTDGTNDRIVVTWAENDFGCEPPAAFPACGNRAQLQLRSSGQIVFGYDLAYAFPQGAAQRVMVGLSKGGLAATADPGGTDWVDRAVPISIGDTGYQIYGSNPRKFDLVNRNLVFTPAGVNGYSVSIVGGPNLGVTLSSPPTGTVGQAVQVVATVDNHGEGAATDVTFTSEAPAGAQLGSASAGQGSCTPNGNEVSCALGNLAPGASTTVTLTLTPGRSGEMTTAGRVRSLDLGDSTRDNSASATTAVAAASTSPPADPPGAGPVVTVRAASQSLRNVRRKGLRLNLGCSLACDTQVIVKLRAKEAKKLGLQGPLTVGAANPSLAAGKTQGVRIRAASKIANRLLQAKSLRFSVRVTASSESGETIRSTTVTIKR